MADNESNDPFVPYGKPATFAQVWRMFQETDKKLWKAKEYMPEYKERMIYGGVAFLTAEGASDRMAENLGMFVIKATGNSSVIINKSDFKPKTF